MPVIGERGSQSTADLCFGDAGRKQEIKEIRLKAVQDVGRQIVTYCFMCRPDRFFDECSWDRDGHEGIVTPAVRRRPIRRWSPVELGHIGWREGETALQIDQQRLRFGRIEFEKRRVDFYQLPLDRQRRERKPRTRTTCDNEMQRDGNHSQAGSRERLWFQWLFTRCQSSITSARVCLSECRLLINALKTHIPRVFSKWPSNSCCSVSARSGMVRRIASIRWARNQAVLLSSLSIANHAVVSPCRVSVLGPLRGQACSCCSRRARESGPALALALTRGGRGFVASALSGE